MKPTLVILAAGMASRYGSLKQVEGFGPSGETIMDYSISDAIKAGFGKIVFIIREEFVENFKILFTNKLEGKVEFNFAFQSLDMYINGRSIPEERTKPWGTGHAILCTKNVVNEPFAVINADDFYGADSFIKAYNFLVNDCNEKTYSVIGYILKNTLSDYGTVNRGVCTLNNNGLLSHVVERIGIGREGDLVTCHDGLQPVEIDENTIVSMNFWCFHPSIYNLYEKGFDQFLNEKMEVPKSEFLIPEVVDDFINKEGGKVDVIATDSIWFGVTYKEDAPIVQKYLNDLIAQGAYSNNIWG